MGKKKSSAPKPPAAGKGRKEVRWKCSLSKGASYTDGNKTYYPGKGYTVSEEVKNKLKASGMFVCQPAK